DLEVQPLDLLQQIVGLLDGALDAAVSVLAHGLDLAADAAGFVEAGLGAEQGFLAPWRGGGVLGAGGEGGEDGVDLREEAVAARVAEQRLYAVVKFVPHAVARRLGAGVEAGGLQEAVGGQADTRHLDAGPHALAGQRDLVGDLADVAGRVDVGDVV